jgi:hypothetical protein
MTLVTVFVLVHGAWGGAHGFRKVRGPLRAAGHEVFTPSLTGIGERAHLTSPQVCLTTHITDVVNDPAEAEWATARRTPQPAGCFTEPVRLARPLEDYPFTRTYIKATGEPRDDGPFWAAADRAQASPAWRYHEIATNHMVASNRPEELTRLLLDLT